jgi:hypothetical protein
MTSRPFRKIDDSRLSGKWKNLFIYETFQTIFLKTYVYLERLVVSISGGFNHGEDENDENNKGDQLSHGQVKVLQIEPAHVGSAVVVVLECDGGEQDPGRDSPSDHHVLSSVQKAVSWDNLCSEKLTLCQFVSLC